MTLYPSSTKNEIQLDFIHEAEWFRTKSSYRSVHGIACNEMVSCMQRMQRYDSMYGIVWKPHEFANLKPGKWIIVLTKLFSPVTYFRHDTKKHKTLAHVWP